MTTLTVNAGGPDIEPGVYPVVLSTIEGPKTIIPKNGPNAGQEVDIYDWTFHTDDGTEIQGTTSANSGPRSKMYAWLTALLGGRAPAVGQSFEVEALVGRMALATIEKTDSGWPRLANLGAMPKGMLASQPAAPVAAPVAPVRAAAPAAAPVDSDLPF